MSKSSDYLCVIIIIVSTMIDIVLAFFAGEMWWIYILGIIAGLVLLLLYHYVSKEELSKRWEQTRR
ncbi:MAG: hypothetical protein ACFFHD_08465 [Promethearchaeota archaeon]